MERREWGVGVAASEDGEAVPNSLNTDFEEAFDFCGQTFVAGVESRLVVAGLVRMDWDERSSGYTYPEVQAGPDHCLKQKTSALVVEEDIVFVLGPKAFVR